MLTVTDFLRRHSAKGFTKLMLHKPNRANSVELGEPLAGIILEPQQEPA